ncbi:MAG TPA: hypothetical protein PLX15_04490, partial [Candidatus Woesearchaeota archaeon]|nr:hypothetical protein [Candidatus Woesearchaeota archaeon]
KLFSYQQPSFNTAHAFILPTYLALWGEVVDFGYSYPLSFILIQILLALLKKEQIIKHNLITL